MAEDKLGGLHIDTDWKKQAQEEKRRLAEEAAKRQAAAAPPLAAGPVGPSATPQAAAGADRPTRGRERDVRPASFATLVNSLMTQALLYLGDLAIAGGQPMTDLDRAKQQVDLLGILEDKTRNNLSPDEQKLLDAALYETRSRFVSVASQYL
jgi:hypothetical protein